MRTVAFVENIEFEYQGNVFNKAISVGDVDNDQNNELILGTMCGDLYIFKGRGKKPWAVASELGTNSLVVLTSEGSCYVFVVEYDHIPQDDPGSLDDRKPVVLKPVHKQHILANNKALLIADINGDGLNELVIGYSDRQVRMYKWVNNGDDETNSSTLNGQFQLMYRWHLAGQVQILCVCVCVCVPCWVGLPT
ncbi:hypothetical protein LSH36_1181g00025 [Paralvinella palmiformis]|uniref:Uncharacterized protein n=1 Tax=Paralvinella palmiformis TaxID=53620 RepID=A0AAD9IUX1_9ANNE|nr:hypothetical protein LSH36_1181g00025 [Paralvinella palmiformis]